MPTGHCGLRLRVRGVFPGISTITFGPAGANTATARKLACMIYHLLKFKEDFIDVDRLVFQERHYRRRVASLSRQAEELGFELTKKPTAIA